MNTLLNKETGRVIFSAYEVGRTARRLHEDDANAVGLIRGDMSVVDVETLYAEKPELDFLPIRNELDEFVGYVRRESFLAALGRGQYARELLLRPERRIDELMDERIVCLDAHCTLSEASRELMARPEEIRFDPFVVLLEDRFHGISSVRRVLDGLNHYFNLDMDACKQAQDRLMEVPERAVENTLNWARLVQPLNGPGGDYVKVFDLDEDLSVAVLFDVCGKGIKAANMVMAIGSVFESLFASGEVSRARMGGPGLAGRLSRLNNLLWRMTPEEMYATGVVLLLEKRKYLLRVFEYGHGLLWLRRGNRIHRLADESPPELPFLGIRPDCDVQAVNYRLKPGDLIFSCSDGVTEMKNRAKEEFGLGRTTEVMGRGINEPSELVRRMHLELEDFRDGARIGDDVSMLAVLME